jgi:diaminohydroxyphosphoribosylaminopyrimidine deaminase/5-amino-6-(5-phosphoribosylamino)uracil reductase
VVVGLYRKEAERLNPGFVSRMTKSRPWIWVKSAASLDGKIAMADGESQWMHVWMFSVCAHDAKRL